ncbi:MAG TPA: KH domain-containing protein [Candidatus Saccharimonadales bacterium]
MSEIDQQFVEYVVKSLVGKPDAVKIERRIDEKGVLLELTVDPEDLGRVIGKRGATAQSLRTLLRALGTKNDARYNLKIIDNGEGGEQRMKSDAPSRDAPSSGTPDDSTPSDDTSEPAEDTPETPEEPEAEAPSEETPEEESEPAQEEEAPTRSDEDQTSDRLAQTRQELADLDDLDV